VSFFVSSSDISDNSVYFSPEDSKHIYQVLRMSAGDDISVCDDSSHRHMCRLVRVGKDSCVAEILSSEEYSNQPTARVTVYAGLSKGDRFDYLIQKCVECGVYAIVPFISERCIARPTKDEFEKKVKRYQKIADEAVRQSKRSQRVLIGNILTFDQAIENASSHATPLFLYENENQKSLSTILRQSDGTDYSVFTGPEGGFSENEVYKALDCGMSVVSIGPRIMRCETAPVAALCAIMYHTGNFDIGE
jgi:16S rRNA (uracil1498-N3)-methyltransferase